MADLWPVLIPVLAGLVIVVGLIARVQSGKPIVPRVPAGAEFAETWVSGRAVDRMGRLGRANRCLIVYIDRERLVVRLAFPFTLMPLTIMGTLECDEPLNRVACISTTERMWQQMVRIDFVGAVRPPIELALGDEAGFSGSLGAPIAAGNRALRQGQV